VFVGGHRLVQVCVSPVGNGTLGPSKGSSGGTAAGGGPAVEYVNESGGRQTVTATFESLTPDGFGTFVAESFVLGPGGTADFRTIDYARLDSARMKARIRAQRGGASLATALRNQLSRRINVRLRGIRAIAVRRGVVRFTVPMRYRAPGRGLARMAWRIRGIGPRGRHVTTLTGRRLLRLDRLAWQVVLPTPGRYTVRVRLAIIAPGAPVATLAVDRRRTFRMPTGPRR
jgi:hypothetical protein